MGGIADVHFTERDRLLAAVQGTGLVSFDLKSGASRVVVAQPIGQFVATRDGRFAVGTAAGRTDGEGESGVPLSPRRRVGPSPPDAWNRRDRHSRWMRVDSFVATGSSDGTIRVGRVSGEEPHLLLGQQGSVHSIAFSPDGRWLATGGEAFAVHVWPMPDPSKPPLHRRSRADLLNVLRSHTNLQAIPDAASATGYKLIPGPFPGWAKVPEW